ncbi:MAG: serine--tRNA ligase [Candidatus Nealsonbacteria bacterium]|nr:serine--tRNA ligase [Candidatus Nealsonbacteria bacterium]
MLDIKFIRQNPEKVKEGIAKKQASVDIDRLLEVDQKRRETIMALEDMFSKKNRASKEISQNQDEREKQRLILEMRELDTNSDRLKEAFESLDKEFEFLMKQIPNLPEDDVPIGKDEKDNKVIKEWGKKPEFKFVPRDYLEISEKLDIIDVKRAAKVAGTRFGYIKGEAAQLEFALVNFAMDILLKEGFVPVVPPVMIKDKMMEAMGYASSEKDKAERYLLKEDNLYLIGTAEQALGPLHADEILENLPRRYAGFSSCFRREAGAYGKDTKGILRVHQFDKVEMLSFCEPQQSKKELDFLLEMAERLMQLLKIPYRVVRLCGGDLARPSAATYDIEAWLPGQNQYRETHSVSTTTDFQARRLNIRHRGKQGLEFVHILNGTAFAIGRMLIAIIENYQKKDGSVLIPKVLQKYLKFKAIKR